MNRTVIQKFLVFLELLKFLGNICYSEQLFRKEIVADVPLENQMHTVKWTGDGRNGSRL